MNDDKLLQKIDELVDNVEIPEFSSFREQFMWLIKTRDKLAEILKNSKPEENNKV